MYTGKDVGCRVERSASRQRGMEGNNSCDVNNVIQEPSSDVLF